MKNNLSTLWLFILIILTITSCNKSKKKKMMDLSKAEWKFHERGSKKILPAKIPGCVQTDLLANGEIPDPYYRTNEDSLQCIGEKDWIYQTEFSIDLGLLKRKNQFHHQKSRKRI